MEPIKHITVLIVEDNPADARLILEVFNSFATTHEINVVTDGVEATDYLYKKGKYKDYATPNLILLDLNLPKKDGREVLKEIKNNDKLSIIPVIVLTTSRDEGDICGSYRNHANAYVTKPTDFEEFEKLISTFEDFWLKMTILPTCGTDKE